jgi:pyridoxamine 5'-phosphate oxidase
VVKRHARTLSAARSLGGVPIAARPLHARDLDPDPFVQFQHWYADAEEHGQLQPDAMVVATSTPDGRPSARMVLLRGVDERGFCFYTNFDSRKGRELAANGHVAIALHWPEVLRQVRATGVVERVADDEADAYWFARPRASRVSAWASAQSDEIADRDELEARVAELEVRFADGDVPRPHNWGGFRVVPYEIEFWQHRDDRLHDRFLYARNADRWRISRLQP